MKIPPPIQPKRDAGRPLRGINRHNLSQLGNKDVILGKMVVYVPGSNSTIESKKILKSGMHKKSVMRKFILKNRTARWLGEKIFGIATKKERIAAFKESMKDEKKSWTRK